jgi:hypothetical protein
MVYRWVQKEHKQNPDSNKIGSTTFEHPAEGGEREI